MCSYAQVRLQDIPNGTLLQLLSHMYGAGGIPVDDINALLTLLDAATRFLIDSLRILCEVRLCRLLNARVR